MTIDEEIDGRFRSEQHRGLINLIYTANVLHAEFESFLRGKGLTSQQYNVLRILRGFGEEPRSLAFLKKRMLDKHSDMSRIVNKLVQRGLITRVLSSDDRRAKDLRITELGLQKLGAIDAHEQKLEKLLANLSEHEIKTLNGLLDRIRS